MSRQTVNIVTTVEVWGETEEEHRWALDRAERELTKAVLEITRLPCMRVVDTTTEHVDGDYLERD